jgi:hypothetical protein
MTPEQMKQVLPTFYTEEEKGAMQEREMVRQFTDRLQYNLGVTGAGLNRLGRLKKPGKHPTLNPKP